MSTESTITKGTWSPPPTDKNPAPKDIIHETTLRGCRIIQTSDQRFVGMKDAAGFNITTGFVVRDEFDDYVLPQTMQWFYSPYDAAAAIYIKDLVMPLHKQDKWPTTLLYEYSYQWAMRQNFYNVFIALDKIKRLCENSRDFDENPREEVLTVLNGLRQSSFDWRYHDK